MKKLATLAVFATVVVPAYAENLNGENLESNVPIQQEYYYNSKSSASKSGFPSGVQLGAGVSAGSGINFFAGYANKNFESFWLKRLGFRVDFATTSPIKSAINSAIDSVLDGGIEIGDGMSIDGGSVSAKHIAAMVDFYPFGDTWFAGGWRLTGGYFSGSLNMNATLAGELSNLPGDPFEFELDGINYKYSGNDITANANINWKYSGPYLGTGFDLGLFWGIKIYMDAGMVFTSKTAQAGLDIPLTGLEVSHDGGNTWQQITDPGLQDELDNAKANALADANDTLNDIKFYPVIKLGFMYRF